MARRKQNCRICGGLLGVDENGRCGSCADVRYAENMGMSYGEYKGWRQERRTQLRKENSAAYEKIAQAEAGSLVLPKCEVCGEYIWDGRRTKTCGNDCLRRMVKLREQERTETAEAWKYEEPLY